MTDDFTNKVADAFEEMANNQKEMSAIEEFLEATFPESWVNISAANTVSDVVIRLLKDFHQIAFMPVIVCDAKRPSVDDDVLSQMGVGL